MVINLIVVSGYNSTKYIFIKCEFNKKRSFKYDLTINSSCDPRFLVLSSQGNQTKPWGYIYKKDSNYISHKYREIFLVGKLGIKIMFGAFGPLPEHISPGPSPTRKDTPFYLISKKKKKKKRIERERERGRETIKHQPQPLATDHVVGLSIPIYPQVFIISFKT